MRMWRTLAAGILGMTLLAWANAGETITVPQVQTGPRVDGTLRDGVWAEAAVTDGFRVLGTRDPAPARTEARLCATDEMLYVGFRCLEPDGKVAARNTGHTAPDQDDSVEVFLGPRQGAGDYAHFMLGAGGAFFEQKIEGGDRDRLWRTPWVHAVVRDQEGWTAELGIPLYVVGAGTIGEAPLALNLTRNRTTDQGLAFYTWADLKRSFHDPESFGALAGLAGQEVAPAFVPMVASATALSYEIRPEGFAYVVRVELVNSGGKAGTATLRLEDELEGRPAQERTRTVDLSPVLHHTVRWQVPVAELGRRSARVRVQGRAVEWTEVAGTEGLQSIKVYTDRSYYTTEAQARLVCAAVFGQAHARQAGFSLTAEVTGRGGEMVHQGAFAQPGRRSMHAVPIEDLAPGAYTATVTLRDGEGDEVAQSTCELIKRPPGPSTTVKFDHIDNQLLVDGEPFFPVGYMYTGGVWTPQTMKKLSDGGVNCLVRWSGVIGGGAQTEEAQARMAVEAALANRYGIKSFLPLAAFGPRFNYGMSMDEIDERLDTLLEALPEALRRYRGIDGVIGYYGLDEPPTRYYELARRLYLTFQQGDPYRILYGSSWRDWEPEAYELYDLLGRHGYWMPYEFYSPNKLARRCTPMRELAARFHKPFVATPQGCWREETRKITPHEMRMSYYVPLIQGAKALIIFVYRDDIHPAEWKAATEIFSEVNALAPVLLEESPPQNVTCNLAAEPGVAVLPPGPAAAETDFQPVMQESGTVELPAVQVLVKNHPDGGEVILAANSANRPREVQYTLSSLTADSRVVNFFDPAKTYERLGEAGFSDRLEGWGVRVYRTLNTDRAPDDAVRMAVNVVDQAPAEARQPTEARAANVLADAHPGFETEALGERWSVFADTKAQIVTDDPAEGERALAMESNPDGWARVDLRKVPLAANARYEFSFQYRNAFTAGRETAHALVLVPGQHDTPPRIRVDTPLVQEDWDRFSRQFTTEDAVTASIMFRRQGGQGSCWIDDLRIVRLDEPGREEHPKNLLNNASFEQCTYFGKPDWWLVREFTSDLDQRLKTHEYVSLEDAYHGDQSCRAGWFAQREPNTQLHNVAQRGTLDFGHNYVFSIYLKADREDAPVTLYFVDRTRFGKVAPTFSRRVSVGTEWRRYALQVPLKDQGFEGERGFEVAIGLNYQADVVVDAAQLEVGAEPTAFEVDDYRAVDLGLEYSREAVLGEE